MMAMAVTARTWTVLDGGRTDASDDVRGFLASKRSKATRAALADDLRCFGRYLSGRVLDDDTECETLAAADLALRASVAAVVGWRDAMTGHDGKPAAPATVARRIASLRTFYRYAASVGLRHDNPAELVETPRVEAARQRAPFLTVAEARALLDVDTTTTQGKRDRAILGLLACAGLRRAEAAGLCAGDVHAEATGVTVTVNGKGGKVRTVDVDRGTAEALLSYLAADGRPLGSDDPAAPVFKPCCNPRPAGGLTTRAVNKILVRAAEAAGLDPATATPHALRRTFATVALDRGGSLESLRRTLGHSDPRTTARYDRRREGTVTVTY